MYKYIQDKKYIGGELCKNIYAVRVRLNCICNVQSSWVTCEIKGFRFQRFYEDPRSRVNSTSGIKIIQ